MKKILIILMFLVSCGSDIKITEEGIDYKDEDKCAEIGAQRCKDQKVQVCFGDYWGTVVNCKEPDGGTCCYYDAGPGCC